MKKIIAKWKYISLTLFSLILLIISYRYLSPIDSARLLPNMYKFSHHHVGKSNYPAVFTDKGNGYFYVQTGNKNNISGAFKFKKDLNLNFEFGLNKKSNKGSISFSIEKNGNKIEEFVIYPKKSNKVNIQIVKGDKLKIFADKNGTSIEDWGQIKIKLNDNYTSIIIPLLWIIFIIFLIYASYPYIAFVSYFSFYISIWADKLNFGLLSFNAVLYYSILFFGGYLFLILINQLLLKNKKDKLFLSIVTLITALYILIPTTYILYSFLFETGVTKEICYTIYESNFSEISEFILNYFSLKYMIFIFIFIVIWIFIIHFQKAKLTKRIDNYFLFFIIFLFLTVISTEFSQLKILDLPLKTYTNYKNELNTFIKAKEYREQHKDTLDANTSTHAETAIVVIGESLNKTHMGIYGYFRDTTPRLEKFCNNENFIKFENVYSNYVLTSQTLMQSLTAANQYNSKNFITAPSILDILEHINSETYWITNQILYSDWDNKIAVLATEAKNVIALNKNIGVNNKRDRVDIVTTHYDDAVIEEVKKILSTKTEKNRVIFVHLMGSHVRYKSRYPNRFKRFKKSLSIDTFGSKVSKVDDINAYDNSVFYNDYVLDKLLKSLKNYGGVSSLTFLSDHSDDVDAAGHLAHNISKYTYPMMQIPMFIWLSKEYINIHPQKYKNLQKNSEKLFSNDMLYDTLVGLFNIKTDEYSSKYDLTSNDYELAAKDALALHGKIHYVNNKNYTYWQPENSLQLLKNHTITKMTIKNVNTLGKLNDILENQFSSFSLKMHFDKKKNKFVTKYKNMKTSLTLEDILIYIESKKLDSILIEFDTIPHSDVKLMQERIVSLSKKFHVENKILTNIENIYTIQYMSQEKYTKINKEKFFKSIINELLSQKYNFIRFDVNIYKDVKKYIEPFVGENIKYLITTDLQLKDAKFKFNLKNYNDLITDEHVEKILINYYSVYSL